MLKILALISCLLVAFGCQLTKTYTTHGEYVEKSELDKEKGLTESSEATLEIKWKS